MKILHLLSQIPDATGSGIYLQAALRHAAQRGFENYLLAGVPATSEHHTGLALKVENYCPVTFGEDLPFPIVGMSDVMPYPSVRFSDLTDEQLDLYCHQFERKLRAAVERWQPDLIHSHHLWLLTALARQAYPQIPLVTSCHGSDLRQFHNCPHLHARVLPGCQQIDRVCALSTIQKLEIQQLYAIEDERITVVGAGYASQLFSSPPAKKTERPFQLLYAGKLSRAKGLPWLLKALHNIPADHYQFHLVGEGTGEDKEEVLQLAQGLGEAVTIHGSLNQTELAALMRAADLFLLPSFFEGLPLVLLEALACGCRVITTALPGIEELFAAIEQDWVERIELPQMIAIDSPHPADEDRFTRLLTEALQRMLARLEEKEGISNSPASVEQLLQRYTWEGVFEKIETLYREVVRK